MSVFRILALSGIKIYLLYFISNCVLDTAQGQYMTLGRCPRVSGMRNFNISSYEGIWYEVEKYWFIVEATASCVTVEYLDNKDGTFGVEISMIEGVTRQRMVNPGHTWYQSRDGTADFVLDLVITQSPLPFHFKYPYLVLDTDYVSYTIKYSCTQVGLVNVQNMWILSRTKDYPNEVREKVHSYLRRVGLNVQQLRRSNLNTCPDS